ncbi:MAG: hypothetical protein WC346_02765 [Methanogenium sp.]|jgi:thymidylate kinase
MSIFIFCGGDGLGKTTITKQISTLLDMPYVKYPYGSDNNADAALYSGKVIREILNDKEHTCDPTAFQALQFVNKLEAMPIITQLEAKFGAVFIDRCWLSAKVYGGVDNVDDAWSDMLCRYCDSLMPPTLLFVFIGKPFKKDNDIYGEKQLKIAELYNTYCESQCNNDTVVVIDVTDKSIMEVTLECLGHITKAIITNKQPGSIFGGCEQCQ